MILIASPCGYVINRNFIECREDVITELRKKYQVLSKLYQGVSISLNRNEAILDAYHNPSIEWLVFIDTDMEFGISDIELLFSNGGDVVTGVCKNIDKEYCLYDFNNVTGSIDRVTGLRKTVDICGGAFFAIRRNVVQRLCDQITINSFWGNVNVRDLQINYPFNLVTGDNGFQYGEDVSFCLRLKELGIKIHVEVDAKIGHEKIVCIR